jgi:peptidoglycan/xylan/chitin deacetylase (PgdA/CDA1 family)
LALHPDAATLYGRELTISFALVGIIRNCDHNPLIDHAHFSSADLPMFQDFLKKIDQKVARYYASKSFRMQNRAPLVSFTFDDVPDSAYINGASILEDRGIHGTFFIASGISDTTDSHWHYITPEQIRALHDRGHEIGCHTFSHANVETLNAARMDEECRKNHNLLRRICGDIQLTNFAYPSGGVTLMRKLQLQRRFDTCRGKFEGVNFGTIDLGLLKVVELQNRTLTPEKLQRVLRETCDRNGWLIFYALDVADPPSWIGCSPDFLRSTVETVQAMGLNCVTVRDALKQIGYSMA